MKNIIISDKNSLAEKKKRIRMDGLKNLFVVSDYDRTLTKAYHGKKKVSSLIAILREHNYLGKEYMQKAKDLFEKYHPFEIDTNLGYEEKNKKMEEWWRTHNKMFIKYKLSKKILADIARNKAAGLRGGTKRFFSLLKKESIPLLIVSATSLGDIIDDYLKKEKLLSKNVRILTNYFMYDEKGFVVGAKEPVITSTNKNLAINEHMSELEYLNGKKKNVLLFGDNYEDRNMADSFDTEDVISVGFLNESVEERMDDFKRVYDVVILNDGKMDYPNSLLKELA